MRKRILVLVGITVIATALVAWGAVSPLPYTGGPDEILADPYPWEYPILSAAFGLVVTALLSFARPSFRFAGALISSAAGMFLVVRLLLTVMRSPQGHEMLFFVALGWTIGLLVYSGYTLALWRSTRVRALPGNGE